MNRLEWELRKEREKVQILLRPSAGAASPTAAIAARPAEVKELKVTTLARSRDPPSREGLPTFPH